MFGVRKLVISHKAVVSEVVYCLSELKGLWNFNSCSLLYKRYLLIPAFRHIKVFVTYADDSDAHIKRVLKFCNCLEKNGFTCCMDIYHRRLQMEDKVGWYDLRFKEVCI